MRTAEEQRLIIPSVEELQKRYIGMCFSSLEEGELFYKEYAKLAGFASRKHTTKYRGKMHELYFRECVCSKNGGKVVRNKMLLSKKEQEKNKRNRLTTRTWCPAIIRFQKNENTNDWRVVKLKEWHNHIMYTPHKAHLMRQNREVTDAQKNLLNQFNEANISTAQAFSILSMQSGGIEHIGCTEKDLRNYEASLRKERKEYDAQLLVEYFKEKQEMNPSFYYVIDVDAENKLRHCFWADGYARKAYVHFGDVVVFDTTYDTNQYHLIFAPFTGINHHRQSVGLGWALLKDEKIESFVWLFKKFLEAMAGHAPKAIVTDQDPAMKNAISQVFPNTFHRLCMWHILQKLPDKLRPLGNDPEFCSAINRCVYHSEIPEDFEREWGEIVRHYKVENDKWLSDIYSLRGNWIPAYFKSVFMGGVRTTQRSESLNAFFDRYVNKRNTLMEFIVRFRLAIERQRYNKFKANFENVNSRSEMKTVWAIEKQMVEIYSQANFCIFQDELVHSAFYGACFDDKNGDLLTFIVRKIDMSGEEIQADIHDPEKHIRKDKLSVMWGPFMQNACSSMEAFKVAKEVMEEMISSFHSKCQVLGISLHTNNIGISAKVPSQVYVHPPELSKTKGSGKRLKGWKEKVVEEPKKTKRLCHGCNQLAHHDKRNCPNLKEMETTSTSLLVDEDDHDHNVGTPCVVEEEINLTDPYFAITYS